MIDVHDLVVRLREEANRMPATSRERSLLREAASTIEMLDSEARRQTIEAARLTARLAHAAP
jgi:hypothetical protein